MTAWEKTGSKPHYLAKEFFFVQGKNVFVSGHILSDFWKVKAFFGKLDESTLNLLHEYLATVKEHRTFTMKELFECAKTWNSASKVAQVKETKTNDYMKLLKEW